MTFNNKFPLLPISVIWNIVLPGYPSSVPGSGRSPGEGIGYPLQYSSLENSMDCLVLGVTKSQTRLGDFHFRFQDKYGEVEVRGLRTEEKA